MREARSSRPAAPREVAFVSAIEQRDHGALLRAVALATARGAALRVILAVGITRATSCTLFPHRAMDALRGSADVARRVRDARRWASRLAPGAEIETARGDVAAVGISAARGAELLVLPARDLHRARDAAWIATESGAPVLVARPTRGRETVLAATAMNDPAAPVLARAAAFASWTRAPLAAVHNSPAFVVQPLTPHGTVRTVGLSADQARKKEQQLARLLDGIAARADTFVSTSPSTPLAVLETASAVAADVVAVGTRKRAWLDRVLFGSVAEAVLDHAAESVLVTPLPDRAQLAPAPP